MKNSIKGFFTSLGTERIQKVASDDSRAAVGTFMITFIFLMITTPISPGIIGGFLFIIVGAFAISALVAMPLFIITCALSKITVWVFPIMSFAKISVFIWVTNFAFMALFS